MISNITNSLPALLKHMKDTGHAENASKLSFSLVEAIKFYQSILPVDKAMSCLKHLHIDVSFKLNKDHRDALSSFCITLDTHPFLKDFDYIQDVENGVLTIRSNYENLAIFSLLMIGSIKNLPDREEKKNKSVFVSLAYHFITYCINNGYNVCETEMVKLLEDYNEGFDSEWFDSVSLTPTSDKAVGTIHFIGIELKKEILAIFEKYSYVKFTYNEDNASFIISMKSNDWDDFWSNAPKWLIDEFKTEDEKIDVR